MEEFIIKYWSHIGAIGVGVLALLKAWNDIRAAEKKLKVDLIQIANQVASDMLQKLQARLEHVEAELAKLRREHHEMLLLKDNEITLLRGRVRNMQSIIRAYQDLLRRHNIQEPRVGEAYWELGADGTPLPLGGVDEEA